tara:strand:+ start:690 stop:1706 length:1017 start_codon:yes stop_codon:yes gene_type:complete
MLNKIKYYYQEYPNTINFIFIIFLIIITSLITYFLTNSSSNNNNNNLIGGSKKTDSNINPNLSKMISNGDLTDQQKLKILEKDKNTLQQKVNKYNNIYNNILSNLSSTEDEIETAELNLEDAKNNLSLAEINITLKNSLITQKKNKNNPKTKELDTFNVAFNIAKQYSIQSIISINNTRKLRRNTLISPKDSFFKKELLKSLKVSLNDTNLAFIKANEVYLLCISSSNPEITKHKSDLTNSKNIAKDIENNIININKRITEKYKLENSIKKKLKIKKTTTQNINKYKDITPPPQNTTTPSQNTNTPNITQLPLPASTSPPVQEEENTSIFDTIADIFT